MKEYKSLSDCIGEFDDFWISYALNIQDKNAYNDYKYIYAELIKIKEDFNCVSLKEQLEHRKMYKLSMNLLNKRILLIKFILNKLESKKSLKSKSYDTLFNKMLKAENKFIAYRKGG